ncbi:Helix-turn-helix domain [Moraxella lacunata]|uniref:Helix-turn-helix domain n=1 Tax=Moraxella lacunata TaxID=477 RepID=A0A378TRS0_MORLA|nr:helix-turn-helix transcriptional regulator [Moraxella lacunata]STZ63476.1 Helix-turn-helix domain [Moraxella lacunata]
MSLQQIFTRRFKVARKAKNLTQEQLGIAIGLDEFVASSRINRYEKGVHLPDLTTLNNIATVLEVPPAYFFADDELAQMILAHKKADN